MPLTGSLCEDVVRAASELLHHHDLPGVEVGVSRVRVLPEELPEPALPEGFVSQGVPHHLGILLSSSRALPWSC